MRHSFLGAAAAGCWLASAALAAPTPTVQQQFETATAALDSGRWADAITAYEALERSIRNPRTLAVIRVRKGRALAGLGRIDEAASAFRLGLSDLPTNDPSLIEDRYLALVTVGEIAQHDLDYGQALESFRAAKPLMTGMLERSRASKGLILTGMFYDAPAALAEADASLAAIAAEKLPDKRIEAMFRNLRGRVLLNLGRPDEAKKELFRAITLLGGLTSKVDAADLAARSDLSIAALRSGDEETARQYLAWTGAGQFANAFPSGAEMTPPPCGEDLTPDDVAVVEFSIRDDGSVGTAQPIFASRQGPSALAFARAVQAWSWKPEALAKIGSLFRAMTRVEMRCTTSTERPSVLALLRNHVDDWLAARGFPAEDSAARSDARRLQPLKTELARRETASGPDSLALVPVLANLAVNAIVPRKDGLAYLARAEAIARREKAPAAAIAWFRIAQLGEERGWERGARDRYLASLQELAAKPEIAADSTAAGGVRLEIAETLYRAKRNNEAMAELRSLASTPGLGEHDALRAAALVRLASLELAAGDDKAARATFARSGLTADQCSLVDTPPRRKSGSFSDSDFPMDAERWGFEGWVRTEWDVSATGAPVNVRTTVAYPPFVFSASAVRGFDRLRYEPTFRPGGGLACGGMSSRVNFRRGT
ncbi:MAG: hypothetical protein JWP15_1252 [Alphaproteobacteria bacterium]|nr:hypothetical protein [Alphaproteobacteria bacterium]